MKLSIIANPVAGGGRAYMAIQQYVRRWTHPEWEVEILTTQAPNHAGILALQLLRRPPDLVAICGGDGTVNEVASRIQNPPFPIALLPAGTANVVARELGLPLDPTRALQIALKRTVRHVDLGELDSGSRRRFLFVAGIGFDAYVVSKVRSQLKIKLGMIAYAIAIVDCLRTYSFPEFQVVVGSRTLTATSCLACNAKSYGGGLLFCPGADMGDGLLDILVIQRPHRLALARFLFQAWRGRPETHDWIHRLQARMLRIEGPAEILVQADGELSGHAPLDISLVASVFPLVIP
jgi:diacylglycerol kinase (ATP)